MRCDWQSFINLLPVWMRQQVHLLGCEGLQELRLRLEQTPELVLSDGIKRLNKPVCHEDLQFCVNAASRYSPWAASTVESGYLTAPGGHRIGLCGTYHASGGMLNYSSLCLRVARDFPGISNGLPTGGKSVLILGKPGSGKTTLLRDYIRTISDTGTGSVAVVDERQEIFPINANKFCFPVGKRTDVLSGCKKPSGIEFALRNMGPTTIAVDEITAQQDCQALTYAGWCGVHLIATAHASSRYDLLKRPVYRPIVESNLFDTLVILQADKSWRTERMNQ